MAEVMRRRQRVGWVAAIGAASLFVLHVVLWRPLELVGDPPQDGLTRVAGAVHVHTTFSDGGGTPAEVIAAARAAGLRFVAITDHNVLDSKSLEGYHDGVLVLVGSEISTTAGHILGLGIPDPVFRFSGDAWDALDDVHELGGIAFTAHPTSPLDAFRWTGWDLPGPWGIEILNGDTQWREAGWWGLLRTAALYCLNRRYALLHSLTSPTVVLSKWDDLLRERDVAGIVGVDAHSRVVIHKQTALRFPSYESLFGLAQNHILLDAPLSGDHVADERAVLAALARGRSYMGLDALAPASGFFFVATDEGRRWTMGDTVPITSGIRLKAGGRLPRGAWLGLFRDGHVITGGWGSVEAQVPGPGVYRVEVRVPGWDVPWVLSNPIYVFDAAQAAARVRRTAWPTPDASPPAAAVLDSFEGRTIFEPGFDSSSTMDRQILDPRGGVDGQGAARMECHVGIPGPEHQSPFCAIVAWGKRNLTGRGGLSFWIRADGVYRVWVQVRDENPRSTDEGTEWWFASVRTSLEWRRVAIPFARLRSINRNTDGRLDLDKVRAIVFVVDKGAIKPGTKVNLWLDDVGVF